MILFLRLEVIKPFPDVVETARLQEFLIHRHSILMKLSTVFFGVTPASPSGFD